MQQAFKTSEDREFDNRMRDFYNKKSKNISSQGYEYARWFSSPNKIRQYKFSTRSILYHLREVNLKNCLDVGCGPGTWTKLLLKKYPYAKFTCVDISKEMLQQFRDSIKSKNVKTVESSYLDFDTEEKFDFIFSSRSIEYIPNKPAVIKKFSQQLIKGGKGIIITSPPHLLVLSIKKALGKKIDKEHTKRISVPEMYRLLRKNGFTKIEFYPILFSDFFLVPTSFLFKKFFKKRWGVVSKMFASGYIVKFEKS